MHASIGDFILDLVQNSIEAGSRNIALEITESDAGIDVSLSDDGKGMTEAELARIKDPFYTDGVKHPHRKAGLGIPFLVQGIEQVLGTFRVESEKGKGTSIMFSFPGNHPDTPPLGGLTGVFLSALSFPGDFELNIVRRRSVREKQESYELSKSEIQDVLGDLTDGMSMNLLRTFLAAQEEAVFQIEKRQGNYQDKEATGWQK